MKEGKENNLTHWSEELISSLKETESLCVGVFSPQGDCLYANQAFRIMTNGKISDSFINPKFSALADMIPSGEVLFEGYLSIGDINSVNTSLYSRIYRKEKEILVVGGVNANQLMEQNLAMHQLNREISGLQRELLRKTHDLEKTLSELNEANESLKQSNDDKNKFFQILAHDLRNPFNSLLGFSDLLLQEFRNYDNEMIEMQLSMIAQTSRNAYNLLNELLEWAKSQAGKIPYAPEKIHVEEVLSDFVEKFKTNDKSISIRIESMAETDLFADRNMFNTIMRNLISNAIKFTGENGEITLQSIVKNGFVQFDVEDTGCGITHENQEKLFNTASHFTTYGTKGEKGSGLGLLLCKDFVDAHAGKIWVDSVPGTGTRFSFTMPAWDDNNAKL